MNEIIDTCTAYEAIAELENIKISQAMSCYSIEQVESAINIYMHCLYSMTDNNKIHDRFNSAFKSVIYAIIMTQEQAKCDKESLL